MHGFISESAPHSPIRNRRLLWVLAGVLLLCFILVFLNIGQWLIVRDPLQPAAAIAVLSGGMPDRALEAARVYKQGYAKLIWLTHSTEPAATLAKLSVPFVGEEEYDRQVLIHEGVPPASIEVLDPPVVNTADEMQTIGEALRKQQLRTVILVTSAVHTRRSKTLWYKIASRSGVALIHPVSDDSYDGAHWWRNTHDALDVVREVLGLANAWAGLPLRPTH